MVEWLIIIRQQETRHRAARLSGGTPTGAYHCQSANEETSMSRGPERTRRSGHTPQALRKASSRRYRLIGGQKRILDTMIVDARHTVHSVMRLLQRTGARETSVAKRAVLAVFRQREHVINECTNPASMSAQIPIILMRVRSLLVSVHRSCDCLSIRTPGLVGDLCHSIRQ